jgi:thiamine pyrophosphokinase
MRRVNILLGGPESEYPTELSQSIKAIPGPWVGADRGSLHLMANGIIPDIAIGDFDSISKKEQKLVQDNVPIFKRFPPEKDDTDSELCLLAAREKFNAQEYYVYGATGGRIDHFLVNLFTLLIRDSWTFMTNFITSLPATRFAFSNQDVIAFFTKMA